jgi:alpha-tubulin suppressor-like RCC1 family protein
VTTDNDAWCWGANDVGQLGNDGDGLPAPLPVQVDLGANFTGISAGYNHSCAAAANGNAYCWGQNGNGQLGNLDIADTRRPARVFAPGNEPYVQVSAGRHYSCGLLTTGMMMCWGLNSSGQLGNTGTSQTTIRQPVYVEPGRRFRWDGGAYASFDAGGAHTCAVTNDATALCWGQGDRGQLGSGEWSSMIPHPVR